ncbi:MAG TPA: hypothetical protein VI756_29485, partial [Blastocatellia bacterium]
MKIGFHRQFKALPVVLMFFIGLAFVAITSGEARAQDTFWTSSTTNNINNTNSGNVGIGITNPQATLHIVALANPGIFFDGYGSTPNMQFRWANGTASSPTSVNSGDVLGIVGFRGYISGSGFSAQASSNIRAVASQAWTTTGQGSYLSFITTPTGAPTTSQVERVRIDPFGKVGIGVTNSNSLLDPNGLLDVDGGFLHTTFNSGAAGQTPVTNPGGGLTIGWNASSGNAEVNFYNVFGGANTAFQFSQMSSTGSVSNLVTIAGNGNVGITGTITSGSITSSGTISGAVVKATYQDVAEWVPAAGALPAGTVVVLDKSHANQVTASAKAYDTSVAGVI